MKKVFVLLFFVFIKNVYSKNIESSNWLKAGFFSYENDSVYGKDRYYTNGVQFSFITKDYYDDFFLFDIDFIKNRILNNQDYHNFSFGIGQKMFTPDDITIKEPVLKDRPYAGYLYFFFNTNIRHSNVIDSYGINLGFTGDFSLAEKTQKFIHSLIGSQEPMGWDNQIENQLLLMFNFTRSWLLKETKKNSFDWLIIPKIYTNIGTPFTNIIPTIEFRYGWNLQENDLTEHKIQNVLQGVSEENSVYLFLELNSNFSFYNTFLNQSGYGFKNNINKRLFNYEVSFGLNATYNNFYLKYSNIYTSKEFKEQKENQFLFLITLGFLF